MDIIHYSAQASISFDNELMPIQIKICWDIQILNHSIFGKNFH